ncbi:unnamed protein product [Rotaria sp. Silwood2]|nr:unnamed protein product [Rotaria sp. Silwood2]
MSTTQKFSECVFHKRGKCDVFRSKKGDIHQELVSLSMLNGSLHQHSLDIGVDLSSFTERSLVMNRMVVPDICNDNDMICPYHRYSYGVFWRPSSLCQSPYHNHKRPKATHSLGTDYYTKLIEIEIFKGNKNYEFPIGQKVCRKCSTKIKSDCNNKNNAILTNENPCSTTRILKIQAQERIQDLEISIDSESQSQSQSSSCSSNFMYTDELSLNDINQLLAALSNNIKPLKYQIRQPVGDLSSITIRELKRHYESIVNEVSSFICESMAPGQGQSLLELFEKNVDNDTDEQKLDLGMQSIVEAYQSAPSRKWKLFLLSTVPQHFTRKELQSIFNCNRYMIDKSRHLRHQNDQFNLMNQKIIQRKRIEKHQLEFFFDFLFSSGLIQDVAHGTTFIQFDRGDEILIPHVVRTMMKNHILQLYQRHCIQTSCAQPLSRSTVFRLLDACKMRGKKTMSGLDSFSVDGNAGFDILQRLVKELQVNNTEEKNLLQLIKLSRNYLKFGYRQNVSQDDTDCATHCRLFALSDPLEKDLKSNCNHSKHYMSCIKCNSLLALLRQIEHLVDGVPSSDGKDELEVDLLTAKVDILSWMFHIIRGVQQDKSKQFVMSQLDSQSGLLLSDWAMKVLPQMHREKMDNWFGKKGISLHVDVLFYMDTNHTLKKMTYFTAIDRCLQDMSSVLCVFEHVIDQIKIDLPNLSTLYTRSDNAGCYAGTAVILTRQVICAADDICLKRTDFNEPQRGKDQADRDIAVAKSCLKAYTNRGGNLVNAKSIKEALDESFGSLSGSKTSVIAIDESKCILPQIKIEGITKYHSVAFDDKSITFWQYFDIGCGKSKNFTGFKCTLQTSAILPFSDTQNTNKEFLMKSTLSSAIFFCSVDSCSATFDNEEQLMDHEQKAEHLYTGDCSLSTIDRARHIYIEHLKGARLLEEASSRTAIDSIQNSNIENIQFSNNDDELNRIFSSQGYAIRRRQKLTKITQEHQQFFVKLFRQGENTGKKVTVENAFQEMRRALKSDNTKLFTTNQYLTKTQIRSLFGRLSKKGSIDRRSQLIHNNEKDQKRGSYEESTSSDEDDAENYFRKQQDEELEDLKADEVDNALTCCSDNEYDTDQMDQN